MKYMYLKNIILYYIIIYLIYFINKKNVENTWKKEKV